MGKLGARYTPLSGTRRFFYYKEMVPDYFSQATLYVYQDGDVIKGFLGVSEDNIDMLFVDPAYLGQEIGRASCRERV